MACRGPNPGVKPCGLREGGFHGGSSLPEGIRGSYKITRGFNVGYYSLEKIGTSKKNVYRGDFFSPGLRGDFITKTPRRLEGFFFFSLLVLLLLLLLGKQRREQQVGGRCSR